MNHEPGTRYAASGAANDIAAVDEALAAIAWRQKGDERFASPSAEAVSESPYVFRIFSDWRGLYWWRLLDGCGEEIRASTRSFAALSGAWRDALAARSADNELARAVLDDARA